MQESYRSATCRQVCPEQIAYFEQMAPGEQVRLSGSLLGGGILMVSERNLRHSVLILTFSTVLLSVCTVVSDRIFLFFGFGWENN